MNTNTEYEYPMSDWLPIKSRIEFKLNLLTYKTLSMCKPSYLICDLLHFENRQQTLISESMKSLHPGPRSGAIDVIILVIMLCYA